jgi:hypothetical protein
MIDSLAGIKFDSLANFATLIIIPALGFVIGWASKMQASVTDLRILIAEKYVHREAIEPILEDLEWMKRTLIRMAMKMGIDPDRP